MKRMLLVLCIVALFALPFALAQTWDNNYNYVYLLSHNALKFTGPITTNGYGLYQVLTLCFLDGTCLTSGNITINASTPLSIPNLPASNVSSGTFGSNTGGGDYVFPRNVTILGFLNISGQGGNSTIKGDLRINGTIYGGSPVKIEGGLKVGGNAQFNDIFVTTCTGCAIINGTTINATNITAENVFVTQQLTAVNITAVSVIANLTGSTFPASYCPAGYSVTGIMIDGTVVCTLFNVTFNGTSGAAPWLYNTSNTIFFNSTYADTQYINAGENNSIILSMNNITDLSSSLVTINNTIQAVNNSVRVYNESGISRNITVLLTANSLNFTIPVPNQDIIYINGVIVGQTGGGAITLFVNGDNQTNYVYRRIQSYRILQQAATVNPQQNVSLEGYSDFSGNRTVEIILYKNVNGVTGDFKITSSPSNLTQDFSFVNTTTGSFTWQNSSAINNLVLRSGNQTSSILAGSYFIVSSERK